MTRLRVFGQGDKCARIFPLYAIFIGVEYVK